VRGQRACAFDAIDAELVREIEPGEIVRIDDAASQAAGSIFAPSSRPTGVRASVLRQPGQPDLRAGTSTSPARRWGAASSPARRRVKADFVRWPMPDSGRSALLGFAKESNIPFEEGHRPQPLRRAGTFILPAGRPRPAVAVKLNIIPDVVAASG
jgi:amidophosphoribosyltransferase